VKDARTAQRQEVVLGEDWVSPDSSADREIRLGRKRRRTAFFNRSPLVRRIITSNLLAVFFLVAGVLFLNPFDSRVHQREAGLKTEAKLLAGIFEARLEVAGAAPVGIRAVAEAVLGLDPLDHQVDIFVFDALARPVSASLGRSPAPSAASRTEDEGARKTVIVDFLNGAWSLMSGLLSPETSSETDDQTITEGVRALAKSALSDGTRSRTWRIANGQRNFIVATPVRRGGETIGAIALVSPDGEIDALVRGEQEQIFLLILIAILVSVGLSLLLASTIANPLAELAAAAELGHDRNTRRMSPGRVRIPDLTARPDEIGRLSDALRGMTTALYDRIDANEQFAADVAHEIKNPLASLRSAVGTLRVAQKTEHRDKLLNVIEHDVRRLDRLVSDISNASRLDSELVKEEEEPFNLLRLVGNLADHLSDEAAQQGIDLITDLPGEPIIIHGLEPRLAQVFVNLISNAISFCESGDAIRVWARRRENRVLVVIEDTGPGIPEQALNKIFNRFYSERPGGQFGDNSGLGLAISKQIIEAHGGVIWAENIRPTDDDIMSEPLGARFVVGLPT